jgi:protocatechuate 4,5-dioxygenase alpha chain
MSTNALEAFLYKLANDGAMREQFQESPHKVLARFPLTEAEREDVLTWNVRALVDRGCSALVTMWGFASLHGGDRCVPEYIRRMKSAAEAAA